jgi:peptidoglycan hydrolase-like protein with peptidoglycan-binding domain
MRVQFARSVDRFSIPKFPFTLGMLILLIILTSPLSALSQSVTRPILRSGSRGTEVAELQSVLKLLGFFNGSVDGFFGEETVIAVNQFQQAAGVEPDGVVGPTTWNRLFPTEAVPSTPTPSTPARPEPAPQQPNRSAEFPILRRGMTGEAVRGLQQRLRTIGIYDGEIDGVFGEQTETAVKALQQRYQLEPDGVVGPTTWATILR